MVPEIFIAKNQGEEGYGATFKLKIGANGRFWPEFQREKIVFFPLRAK